jgi:hypothetical protein
VTWSTKPSLSTIVDSGHIDRSTANIATSITNGCNFRMNGAPVHMLLTNLEWAVDVLVDAYPHYTPTLDNDTAMTLDSVRRVGQLDCVIQPCLITPA